MWTAGLQALANLSKPWLLVLDNADDLNINYLDYFPKSGVVILTTRNSKRYQYYATETLRLMKLEDEEAQELLFRAANIASEQRQALEADARTIADLLHSHPLALIQAGSYIANGYCSIQEYPSVFKDKKLQLLNFRSFGIESQSGVESRYGDTYTTFEVSAEALHSLNTEAAKNAIEFMSLLFMYATSQLPILLFEEVWRAARQELGEQVVESDLRTLTRWHGHHLPKFMDTDTWDFLPLRRALNLLETFSLLSINTQDGCIYVSMHPLIHAWARERLNTAQKHKHWIQGACVLAFIKSNTNVWTAYERQFQPHLQSIVLQDIRFGDEPPLEVCRMLIRCGWLLLKLRDDTILFNLMTCLLTHLGLDLRKVEETQFLDIYDLFAQNLTDLRKSKDAVSLLQQVVEKRGQIQIENHPDQLVSQYALACAYRENGQIQEAVSLFEYVLEIKTDIEFDVLATQHELAIAYQIGGQVQRAILLLEEVVQKKQKLAYLHYSLPDSQHTLASAYLADGQFSKAVRLLEEVVEIGERAYAEANPKLLASQHELAVAYRATAQTERSISIFKKVIRIRQQIQADDHGDLLAAQHNLGLAYLANEQVPEAISVLEQVVSVKARSLAEDHHSLLSSQHELAKAYMRNEEFKRAISLLEQVVRIRDQRLPADHPARRTSQNELAKAYLMDDQIHKALVMFKAIDSATTDF